MAYNKSFSALVTNLRMKKILEDCSYYVDARGQKHIINNSSNSQCTQGPYTWYKKAGINLIFWGTGYGPYTQSHKNYSGKKPVTVDQMRKQMQQNGMIEVWHGTGQQANSELGKLGILRPGDVATMLSSNSAHAAMWTGEDWRSDFYQGDKPYPYRNVGRGGDYTFIVWRHPDLQDGVQSVKNNTNKQTVNRNNKNDVGGYNDWEKLYNNDIEKALKAWKSDRSIINQIISECKKRGLSLNQTAVILANGMQESGLRLGQSNNIKGGHHGVWQFSTNQYDKFGLNDWNKQLNYFMGEVSSNPEIGTYDKKNKRWYPQSGGNGWKIDHKNIWYSSDDISELSLAFGEGWERYGKTKRGSARQDTNSRTGLARMFRTWLIDNNYFNGTQEKASYNPQQSQSTNNNINYNNRYSQNYSDDDLDEQLRKAREENARLTAEWEAKKKEREQRKINNNQTIEASKDYFSNLKNNYDLADNSYSFLEDDTSFYKNANSKPGSAHIDFSAPFLTYLENIETYQEGGELKNTTYPQYNIKNAENTSKSYFIRPKGPFKGLSTALDYAAIIKKVFSEKSLKNILEETYKAQTQLRVGGTLNKKKVITKALKFRSGGSYDFYDEVYNPDKEPPYEGEDPIVKGVKWVGKQVGKGAKKYWNQVRQDWNKSKNWNNDAVQAWYHPEYEPDYDPESLSTDDNDDILDVTNQDADNNFNNESPNAGDLIENEQITSGLSNTQQEPQPQEQPNVNQQVQTTQESIRPNKTWSAENLNISERTNQYLQSIINHRDKLHTIYPDLGEQVFAIGNISLDFPYKEKTLDSEAGEKLSMDLENLDCTTFVENSLAIAKTLRENDNPTFNDFYNNLESIRYRNGRMDGYASRLHYISDWINDNVSRGNIEDITKQIHGYKSINKPLNYMTSHRNQYLQIKNNTELYNQIADVEKNYKQNDIPYIPKNKLNDTAVCSKLRTGDVVAFVTNEPGLDFSHMGIIRMGDDGRPHLLHASSTRGKVFYEKNDNLAYQLHGRKDIIGIRVLRLTDNPIASQNQDGQQIQGQTYNEMFSQNGGRDLRITPERRQQAQTPPMQYQNQRRNKK